MKAEHKKKEKKEPVIYVADFETTVLSEADLKKYGLEEQAETEVWSAAICKCVEHPEPDMVTVYNNIYEFFNHLERLEDGAMVYFHNLRFDGSYILNELINEGFVPATTITDIGDYYDEEKVPKYANDFEMLFQPNSYKACISNMGQYYSITIRFDSKTIQIRDSAKLLPLTLKEIGEGFQTKYQKLEMEYEGDRHAFGAITAEELDYIKNDVLVLSEALWKARNVFGLKELTIASCALKEFKNLLTEPVFDAYFPDLREVYFDNGQTAYEYVKKSYFGGWCYVKEDIQEKVFLADDKYKDFIKGDYTPVKNIIVLDVNSLYPDSLHSTDEGEQHWYPVGVPEYFTGEPTEDDIKNKCVFRRFKCHFDIKEDHLPFIHIRDSRFYRGNECLKTDKVCGKDILPDGTSTIREFTMTQIDFELFCDQYDLTDYEPIDYCTFDREEGIFDVYIDKWMANKIKGKKEKNKALTLVSKLLLNSLYGRLATSENSSSKFVYQEDGVLKFKTRIAYDKKPVAIGAGSYCTAIARNKTIRAAQANYHSFAYADTDSIHCYDVDVADIKGCKIDRAKLGYWKAEVSKGAVATYVKQKTYIEVATEEDFEEVVDKEGNKSYNFIMKAAGLSSLGKNVFLQALLLDPTSKDVKIEVDGNTFEFPFKLHINDFKSGFGIAKCNLKAKQIKGGVLLCKDDFHLS